MAISNYKTKSLLTDGRIKTIKTESVKVVDKATAPDIYELIVTDGAIIPKDTGVTLVDGDKSETRIGINRVWSECYGQGSGDGSEIPTGTNRQIFTWDENGTPIADEFTPDQWSDFPNGAPTEGQWLAGAQFDTETQPEMGFVQVSTLATPITESEGMIPFYSQGGQLRVGTPQFPENAVPLGYFDVGIATKLDVGTGTQSATTYRRGDGTWATPPNTTYTVITDAEADTGTATTARAISALSLKRNINAQVPAVLRALQGYNASSPTPQTLVQLGGVLQWTDAE